MARTTVSVDNLDNLQVDEANRLYWQGEKIITDVMIDFPTWVDFAVGIAAVLGAFQIGLNLAERFGLVKPSYRRSPSEGDGT